MLPAVSLLQGGAEFLNVSSVFTWSSEQRLPACCLVPPAKNSVVNVAALVTLNKTGLAWTSRPGTCQQPS
jgi:hypothetical protein